MIRLLSSAPAKCLANRPIRPIASILFKRPSICRPFCSSKNLPQEKMIDSKSKSQRKSAATEEGMGDEDKGSSTGDTKTVDIFMTVMRVLVVLGVVSSLSSNNRLMEEARVNDKISTDLERTIEVATDSILKEEWRLPLKEKIEKGDKDALNRALSALLVVKPSDEEDDE